MKIAMLLSLTLVVGLAFCMVGCGKVEESKPTGGGAGAAAVKETVAVVNAKCPMMGNKITQAAISVDKVRDYNGKKVGFCCPPCGPKWDALSDADKAAKLAVVMTP